LRIGVGQQSGDLGYAARDWFGSALDRQGVNVATHLLLDVLAGRIDATIVISNDSDLRLPVLEARSRVPVGLVNPTKSYPAGALNGSGTDGVGGHWWYQLTAANLYAAQLPDPVGKVTKPTGW